MAFGSGLEALRRRAARVARPAPDARRLDLPRWRRLVADDPAVARDVVRAVYFAVLEREPDQDGLTAHAARLKRGLPLEMLFAEFARARDAERQASPPGPETIAGRMASELSSLRELVQSQQRTILALTRRLAVLEDRPAEAHRSKRPASPAKDH